MGPFFNQTTKVQLLRTDKRKGKKNLKNKGRKGNLDIFFVRQRSRGTNSFSKSAPCENFCNN